VQEKHTPWIHSKLQQDLTINWSNSRKKSLKDGWDEVSPKPKVPISWHKKSKDMKNSVLFGKKQDKTSHEFSVKKPITARRKKNPLL